MKAATRLNLSWILALLLAVFAIAPLTYPGFFQAHSGFLPVFNVTHPADAPHWGSVADALRGEGRLPYLIAWPIWRLTGSGPAAARWSYGLAFLLGAAGIYGWTRRWLGSRAAVLAAVVYTYLPWHLSAVYVRGAYAEAWLWALWPLILWGVDRLAGPRSLGALVAVALLLGAAFWTQPGLAGLLALLVPVALYARRPRPWLALLPAGAVGLLAAAAALASTPARVPFAAHALYPHQLFSPAWGYGPSVAGWQDDLSFQLGLAALGLAVVGVAGLYLGREHTLTPRSTTASPSEGEGSKTPPASIFEGEGRESSSPSPREGDSSPGALGGAGGRGEGESLTALRRAAWLWAGVVAVVALLTLPWAAPLWSATGLDGLLTYPWQVLALLGAPLAFLAALALRAVPRSSELPAWAGLAALAILAAAPGLAPRFTRLDPGPGPLAVLQPVEAAAPQILLLDAEIAPPTEITPTLVVTLTWQAVEPVAGDYTVFAHLLAPDGSRVAQQDTRPCGGACPTIGWQPGAIVDDRHSLSLAPGAPAGPYRLAIGLYLLAGGDRAAVVGQDERTVILDVP